jgi:hypothetical protein
VGASGGDAGYAASGGYRMPATPAAPLLERSMQAINASSAGQSAVD